MNKKNHSAPPFLLSHKHNPVCHLLKYGLLIITFCLFCYDSFAQQKDSLALEESQIVVIARPQLDGKIKLRWAVTTAMAWRKINTYGVQLKRYTIIKNQVVLPQPIEATIGTFKPKPLEDWMPFIENNDNAAIMAQSLYGENFDVEGQDQLSKIINLSEEQAQRFTWGMYAADQDFTTAELAGLGYIDIHALKDEKYVYKITSLVPETELLIEEGGVFIGFQDYEELPKPMDLAGVFLDQKTMLSWNYAIHKQTYNSYFIERSEDGTNFKRLNDLPLSSLNNSEKTNTKRMFYIDSISNGKKYHYRVLGKTIFGELSPVSETVSGIGKKILAYVPKITNKNYLEDQRILLEWEFLEEGNPYIKGFELNRSDQVNGKYKTVLKNIPPEARKIQYDSLQATNYLTITAIGKNGSSRTSFPVLVQPVDSVPPIQPTGLKGTIDSLGMVTIEWDANKEEDMLGYRVFRGNNKNEEYSQITVSPHQGTTYYDSVAVKNLNPKVYYQLVAVDQRFNMSKPSEILEVKKPDYIKPTQPIFKSYKIKGGKVWMTWASSSSDDVMRHEIYRKEKDITDWVLVHTINNSAYQNIATQTDTTLQQAVDSLPNGEQPRESWTDESVKNNEQYSYTIVAVDESELESDPAPPLTVIIPNTDLPPHVEGLSSYVDRQNGYLELYWKPYQEDNVAELSIYKGIKDQPISLLRKVLPNIRRIVDEKVKPNNEYVYMVQAIFKDGRISQTTTLNVKY